MVGANAVVRNSLAKDDGDSDKGKEMSEELIKCESCGEEMATIFHQTKADHDKPARSDGYPAGEFFCEPCFNKEKAASKPN